MFNQSHMPHEWKEILVVTEIELIPDHYKTAGTLRSEIARYKDKPYGIKKVQCGGNGRQMLIAFDSLKEEIKQALGDPRKPSHILERFYAIDTDAVSFFTKYKFEDGSYLSLAHQEEYITNASVLKACIALKAARETERRTKGGGLKGIMATICADATSFNKQLKQKHKVEHTLPSSERRFKDAFKKFVTGFNYASLISAKLKNTNAKKVTDEVLALLNDLFAGQGTKPTRTEIARQYDAFLGGYIEVVKNNESGEVYDPKSYRKLSENTIINYLGQWEHKIGTWSKRSGDRQREMGLFKPYHSFKRPEHAGRILSIDDRQPPFEYAKGQRPWFYNAIDLGSEAFTCWVYGKSKDGIIIEFYRQLIRNYTEWGFNLPLELECESSLNSSFKLTFLKEGAMFDHVRIEANNARGKRIEAYYRQLRYAVEKDREGWLARPFAQSESNQAGPQQKVQLPYNDIIQGCLRDIEDWNNMPHAVHTDKTRWEVFTEMQTPATKPTNWHAILPHLGYHTTTSCNTGIVKLQGKEFLLGDEGAIYVGDKLISLMKRIEGRTVSVYWLDGNDNSVMKALIFLGDTCICEAVEKPVPPRSITERTPKDEADYQLVCAYVATIDGFRRERRSGIEEVFIVDGRERTLNRKFIMPSITRYEVPEGQTDVPMLPALPEEDDLLMPTNHSGFVRSQADRF
jgi:hypothetical protein